MLKSILCSHCLGFCAKSKEPRIDVFKFAFEQRSVRHDFAFGVHTISDAIMVLINTGTVDKVLDVVAKYRGPHAPRVALQFAGNIDILRALFGELRIAEIVGERGDVRTF